MLFFIFESNLIASSLLLQTDMCALPNMGCTHTHTHTLNLPIVFVYFNCNEPKRKEKKIMMKNIYTDSVFIEYIFNKALSEKSNEKIATRGNDVMINLA